ncbi:hypothetical protein DMB42_12040 [Nonomuraea sp. WAC 01424]|nr:hypothetical protein DMB42_12040 [Nonomuraea sp. WAC 01424]
MATPVAGVPPSARAVAVSPRAVPTHPPLVASPRPPRRAAVHRPAPHVSPQPPPRERSVPEPARVAPPAPEPPVRQGMPDPCATFDDFRRQPCYSFLDRLTR